MLFVIFLQSLFLLAASAWPQTDLEILERPEILSRFSLSKNVECAGGRDVKNAQCPEAIGYIVDEVAKTSLYSFLASKGQKKIIERCPLEEKDVRANYEQERPWLQKAFGNSLDIPDEVMNACFDGVKIKKNSPSSKEAQKGGIAAYFHGLSRNIADLKISKISQLAALDRLLGRPALNDVRCDRGEEQEICDKVRACPKGSDQGEEVTEFSFAALKEMIELENQLEYLRKYRLSLQGKKEMQEYRRVVQEITSNIEYVQSMVPWLEGHVLKKDLEKIKQMIKQKKMGGAKLIFKERLAKQWEESRELLKKEFTKINVSQSCVRDNLFCSADVLQGLNQYYVNDYREGTGEGQEEKMREMGSCIAKRKAHKDVIDERMNLAASVGVGLAVGGAGGVLRLGYQALNFYQKGMRLRGLTSWALLGTEGKMVNDSFSSVAKNCEKAINTLNVQNSASGSDDLCSLNGRSFYKISDLKSCVVDIALTTGAYALSLKDAGMRRSELKAYASTDAVKNILKDLPRSIGSKLERPELKNYSHFLESLNPKDQKLALKELEELVVAEGRGVTGKYIDMFLAREKKFDDYATFQAERIKKNLLKKGESEAGAGEKSRLLALEKRDKLRERFYSCQGAKGNKGQDLTGRRYVGVSMALGVTAAVSGHYNRYPERFENDKMEWFSKLGYDIALMYLNTKVGEKLVRPTKSGTIAGRYSQTLFDTTRINLIDATLYSKFYGVSLEEAAIRVEEIKNSPEAMRELEILEAYVDKENVVETFSKKIIEGYKNILGASNREALIGRPPYEIGGETFLKLNVEDLDKPEVQGKLVTATLRQMNSGEGDPLISTGNLGVDRALNDFSWNAALGVPKGMVLGAAIYQILCMGQDYPFASMGAVAAIQVINQFVSKDRYYAFRKEMIGQ